MVMQQCVEVLHVSVHKTLLAHTANCVLKDTSITLQRYVNYVSVILQGPQMAVMFVTVQQDSVHVKVILWVSTAPYVLLDTIGMKEMQTVYLATINALSALDLVPPTVR